MEGLRAWYAAQGRHGLPWRLTRDAYAVLVSEVMLQQTQVERVIPYYTVWLERWPTAGALAGAPVAEVIRAWAGLGYNRRAVHLHRAATAATEAHHGAIPVEPEALRALPGVGPYTAAAVASFAGEIPVAVVETNVGRVLARTQFGRATWRDVPRAALEHAATTLLPANGEAARHHNLALMDLGALVCRSRAPLCGICPVLGACRWRAEGQPAAIVSGPASERFEETARFARGRLIDALRVRSPLDEAALEAALPRQHWPRLPEYLAALERDGLIAREGEGWTLP